MLYRYVAFTSKVQILFLISIKYHFPSEANACEFSSKNCNSLKQLAEGQGLVDMLTYQDMETICKFVSTYSLDQSYWPKSFPHRDAAQPY